MSINWNFNADEAVTEEFAPIPLGDHRFRIAEVEDKVSQSGNQMRVLTLDVSGHNGRLWHYIVFMPDNTKLTNQKLGQVFDSFGITPGDMNPQSWIGKVGAGRVKHEMYNGEPQAKVHYLIGKAKQAELPPWQEPSRTSITHGGSTPAPMAQQPQPAMPAPGPNGFTQMPADFKAPWEQ